MCHGTKQTIQKVFTCPNDSVSQHERSQKKICKNLEPCLGEPLVYHCVRFKDEFAEVCAPRTMITVKRRRNFRGQDALNLEREFMMQ